MSLKNILSKTLIAFILLTNSSYAVELKQAATSKVSNELNGAKNKAINNVISSFENFITESFPRTEISVTGAEELKPQYEILTVQPLRDDGENITFFQGSLLRWDGDRDTINLGIGQRKFLQNKNIMIGANAFYDHEFQVDHSRLGMGLEFLTSVGELRANRYLANSDTRKNNKNQLKEQVMDGKDIELGTHIPFIPTWKIFAKYFEWNDENIISEGYTYSSSIDLINGFNIEAGLTKYDTSIDNQSFIKISWTPSNSKTNNKKIIQETAYQLQSVEDKKLTKVRRENRILTSKFKFTGSTY